jgi:hypothetical protein
MELHGGTIEINSAPGEGTEVVCTFPTSRVLSGPRGEIIASASMRSETQRKLVTFTG